jgi:hypothetical protein
MSAESRPTAPRETLGGDRLCMECLHPLAGRAIERDPGSGLLFVRCGECGTASALFDYPVVGPWVRRFKAVAASTFVVLALAVVVAIVGATAGLTGGFSAGSSEECAVAVTAAYRAGGGTIAETHDYGEIYTNADAEWLESSAGRRALWRSIFLPPAVLIVALGVAVGCAVLLPMLSVVGVVLMRRRTLERLAIGALLPALGAGISLGILASNAALMTAGGSPVSWRYLVEASNSVRIAALLGLVFAAWGAIVVLAAPAIAAAAFRFVLPPADRRLVAWVWEWRGKSVPKD